MLNCYYYQWTTSPPLQDLKIMDFVTPRYFLTYDRKLGSLIDPSGTGGEVFGFITSFS